MMSNILIVDDEKAIADLLEVYLQNENYNVIATDFKDNFIDKRATIVIGDIFSMENPYQTLGEPDVLLHMAWRDGFVHGSENHINDLPNHMSFISKMIKGGIKHVAVMGSMHEVGFFEGSINENTPCNPQSLYGISKNALRRIVELECMNNNVIFQWLRGFYIVGNTEDGCSIFSKIVQASKAGKKEFPFMILAFFIRGEHTGQCMQNGGFSNSINTHDGRQIFLKQNIQLF